MVNYKTQKKLLNTRTLESFFYVEKIWFDDQSVFKSKGHIIRNIYLKGSNLVA